MDIFGFGDLPDVTPTKMKKALSEPGTVCTPEKKSQKAPLTRTMASWQCTPSFMNRWLPMSSKDASYRSWLRHDTKGLPSCVLCGTSFAGGNVTLAKLRLHQSTVKHAATVSKMFPVCSDQQDETRGAPSTADFKAPPNDRRKGVAMRAKTDIGTDKKVYKMSWCQITWNLLR